MVTSVMMERLPGTCSLAGASGSTGEAGDPFYPTEDYSFGIASVLFLGGGGRWQGPRTQREMGK